jgi:pantoate--beta-alanine ligase
VRTIHTIADVRAYVAAARRGGRAVALVPTMGAFHAGHEALIRAARAACDEVVVSLFVNPAQFEEAGDLAAYPRTAERDAAIAAEHGVDVLFAPAIAEVYPAGFATTIRVAGLSDALEGAVRGAAHFDGVCTIVCKLFTIVAPDVAFFGQKDAQQVVVIRRMVRDLDLPVRLEVVPTVREPDGLALSSRNVRLRPDDRRRARALRAGLGAVAAAVAGGERDGAAAEAAGRATMAAAGVEPEYLAIVDPDSLAAVDVLAGRVLTVVAARVGPVRLIDNILIDTEQVATRDPRAPTPAKEQRCPPLHAPTTPAASRAGP